METKRPEIIIIAREWEPGEAVEIVLVRPSEVVMTAGGGIDLAKTPATGVVLLPGGLGGVQGGVGAGAQG